VARWNTGVILRNDQWTAVAIARFGTSSSLRAALSAGGLPMRERVTFFSMSDRNEVPDG
jgi:hypothetical protein